MEVIRIITWFQFSFFTFFRLASRSWWTLAIFFLIIQFSVWFMLSLFSHSKAMFAPKFIVKNGVWCMVTLKNGWDGTSLTVVCWVMCELQVLLIGRSFFFPYPGKWWLNDDQFRILTGSFSVVCRSFPSLAGWLANWAGRRLSEASLIYGRTA